MDTHFVEPALKMYHYTLRMSPWGLNHLGV